MAIEDRHPPRGPFEMQGIVVSVVVALGSAVALAFLSPGLFVTLLMAAYFPVAWVLPHVVPKGLEDWFTSRFGEGSIVVPIALLLMAWPVLVLWLGVLLNAGPAPLIVFAVERVALMTVRMLQGKDISD